MILVRMKTSTRPAMIYVNKLVLDENPSCMAENTYTSFLSETSQSLTLTSLFVATNNKDKGNSDKLWQNKESDYS